MEHGVRCGPVRQGGTQFVHLANVSLQEEPEGKRGPSMGSEIAEDLPLLVPVHLRRPLVHPLGTHSLFGFRCGGTQVQPAFFKGVFLFQLSFLGGNQEV